MTVCWFAVFLFYFVINIFFLFISFVFDNFFTTDVSFYFLIVLVYLDLFDLILHCIIHCFCLLHIVTISFYFILFHTTDILFVHTSALLNFTLCNVLIISYNYKLIL